MQTYRRAVQTVSGTLLVGLMGTLVWPAGVPNRRRHRVLNFRNARDASDLQRYRESDNLSLKTLPRWGEWLVVTTGLILDL